MKQAQENMELADGRYRNGVGSALEYSDAELVLTQARSNLVQASYQYHQQMAELDHAVGRYKITTRSRFPDFGSIP